MTDTPHGGARRNAGRPVGSRNKISKSAQAQAAFQAFVLPNLQSYFEELDFIATNRELKPNDRIAAIRELLDRTMGRAAQTVTVLESRNEPEDVPTSELLDLWDSCPPADKTDE